MRILFCVVFCASIGLGPAAPSSAAPGSEVRPRKGWLQLQSPNFLLLGDVGARELRQVAERLEQFRLALGIILPKAILATETPTTVVVFKTHKSYEPLKPTYQGKVRNIAGFFLAGRAINYVTLTTENGLDDLGIIYHEYVHLLVNNTVSGLPLWFNEGLAEYYRTFQATATGDTAFIGRVQEPHIYLLREQFLPLEALVAVDHQSPLYNESSKASIFYAESWALVHYLALGEDRKFAAHAVAFAAALGNGLPVGDAAQKTLGISAAELEKGLRRYIGRNVFVSQQIRFSDRMAKVAGLAPTPVGEAEVHATLGDVLLHMGRKNEAQAELGHALALDENLGPAHASLGMLAVQEGQWEASRPHFKRAVASPSANYLCHYYYAVALSQGTGGAQTSVPDEGDIERSFRRAIELNPSFADSYARLAWTLARTPDKGPEATQLMYKALSLAPGREEYILGLGTMLANSENFTAARQLLEPLAAHAADERFRTEARLRLDGIVDYEKRRAEWDAHRTPAGREEPLKTGTGDEIPGTTLKLRTLKPGETRVFGHLSAIECVSTGIVLVAKVGDVVTRARARRFEDVEFVTYVQDVEGQIRCGRRAPADAILLTLQVNPDKRTQGVAIAVEFVPPEYRP